MNIDPMHDSARDSSIALDYADEVVRTQSYAAKEDDGVCSYEHICHMGS